MGLLFSVVPVVLCVKCYLGSPGENLPIVGCRICCSYKLCVRSGVLGVSAWLYQVGLLGMLCGSGSGAWGEEVGLAGGICY